MNPKHQLRLMGYQQQELLEVQPQVQQLEIH
jgi:hypothetical protein